MCREKMLFIQCYAHICVIKVIFTSGMVTSMIPLLNVLVSHEHAPQFVYSCTTISSDRTKRRTMLVMTEMILPRKRRKRRKR